MRKARRDVQNIAGQQFDINDGFEGIGMQQRGVGGKFPVIAPVAHAPVAPPGTLANKDVVQVNVRTDAAAGRGVADHHVIEAPLWNKRKRRHQCGHLGRPVVHRLHDERPTLVAKTGIGLERAGLGLPLAGVLVNQARLHLFFAGQAGQVIGADQVRTMLKALPDDHRLLLPVVRHEVFKGEVSQVEFEHVPSS